MLQTTARYDMYSQNARPVENVLAGFYNHFGLITGAYVGSEHLQSRQAAVDIELKQKRRHVRGSKLSDYDSESSVSRDGIGMLV